MPKSAPLVLLLSWVFAACGGSSDSPLRVGSEGEGGAAARAGSGGSFGAPVGGGTAGAAGTGSSLNSLSVRIEDLEEMAIEIVTVSCAGECASVRAVARGGNPPYTFAWSDGMVDAERELCPTASTSYEVTATDTPIASDEFGYVGSSKTALVTANVLECDPDGSVPDDATVAMPTDCIDLEHAAPDEVPPWTKCGPSPDLSDPLTGVPLLHCEVGPAEWIPTHVNLASYEGAPTPQESLSGKLCEPLRAGSTTPLSLSFPGSSSGDGGFSDALERTSVYLELWGGSEQCGQDELLLTVPMRALTETRVPLCATVTAERDHTHLRAILRLDGPPLELAWSCLSVSFGDLDNACP